MPPYAPWLRSAALDKAVRCTGRRAVNGVAGPLLNSRSSLSSDKVLARLRSLADAVHEQVKWLLTEIQAVRGNGSNASAAAVWGVEAFGLAQDSQPGLWSPK